MEKQNQNNGLADLEQKKNDYLAVFTTGEGKRVLADLENMCFINRSTFSPARDRTILNEGMRYVVVHIKNMLTINTKRLAELIRESE